MSIAWRLALRDLARGGRGLWLLAACLLLGTAALAGIGSLSASILAALDGQGRQALGGDLELRVSQRRATVEEQAAFARHGPVSETIRMRAMAAGPAGGAPVLVDLKGVDARWPLVGTLKLMSGALAARPRGLQLVAAAALVDRLGVHVGDMVRIGSARLRLVGLIADEPDHLGEGFHLGLPAIVAMDALDATGLVQPGSLYDARYRLLLPPGRDARALGTALVHCFPSAGWTARIAADATGNLRAGIAQLGQFLLLVGLAALAIAGVGVANGVGAYLAARTRSLAVLKVLGATSGTIAAMILIEIGLVAFGAVAAGLAIGAALPALVAWAAADLLPVAPRPGLYPAPLATAAALAMLAGLLAALPALARARAVPAASLLRDRLAARPRPSWRLLSAMAALALALIALAVVTATDPRLAAGFAGGTVALLALLAAIGIAVRRGVALLPRPRAPLVRLALGNLHRPGAQTDRLVVALGLGFSLFVTLAIVDTSLGAEMRAAAPAKAPRFFAIDLQPEDEARFRAAIRGTSPATRIEAVPSLRGSVVALNGHAVADMKGLPDRAWILKGDRTITWSATVPPRNRVTAGRWWPANYRGPPLVSIGTDAAEALHLRVGDTITVAVLGVDVPARIAALRAIDWGGLGLNFAIIFSSGYIEEAPHALLASVYAPPDRDGAIARAVAGALPSVTLIRVGDVIAQIGALIGDVALAIRAAAGATVLAGVAVLIGAVAAAQRTRRYDAVLLKLLGGTRRQVLGVQAIEYAVLGALLAMIALLVGGVAGWAVVTQVFNLAFAPDWATVLATVAGASLATLGIGMLGSLPALAARPAAVLRTE